MNAQISVSKTYTKNVSCYGGNDGKLSVSVIGGKRPYKYTYKFYNKPSNIWENIISSDSIADNLKEGVYKVYVVDALGKTSQMTLSIAQPSKPLYVESSTKQPNCFDEDGFIKLTKVEGGTFPYSYNWSNGYTSQNISSKSGKYTVIVTDANGCKKIITDSIVNRTKLVLSTTYSDIKCGGGESTITNNTTGGVLPYTYVYLTLGNSSTGKYDTLLITNSNSLNVKAGYYRVRVIDVNGCTTENRFDNTIYTWYRIVDSLKPITLNYTITQPKCYGDSGIITTSVNGGSLPYTYKWSNGFTGPILKNIKGKYTLIVKDNNGCIKTFTDSIKTISKINLAYSITQPKCYGDSGIITTSVSGGSLPYTYKWSNGFTGPILKNIKGKYTLVLTDKNGCYRTFTDSIINNNTKLNLSYSITQPKCYGDSGVITTSASGGSLPYTYKWGNGFTGPNLKNVKGKYTLLLTDKNGCSKTFTDSILYRTPILLNVYQITQPNNDVSKNGKIELDDAKNGLEPYSYKWNDGTIGKKNFGLGIGNYTVTVTDGRLCKISKTFTLVSQSKAKNLRNSSITKIDEILVYDSVTRTKPIIRQNYPNPFYDHTTIEYLIPRNSISKIEILNSLLQVVKIYDLEPNTNKIDILKDYYCNGVYYYHLVVDGVVISQDNGITNFKFIIE